MSKATMYPSAGSCNHNNRPLESDDAAVATAVANGIAGAMRTFLDHPEAGAADRVVLAHLIEEQGHGLVQLVSLDRFSQR